MNKYEFQEKIIDAQELIHDREYQEAVDICDGLNLELLDQPKSIRKIAYAYEKCRRYKDAEMLLAQAWKMAPRSRGILFRLCTMAVKAGDLENASEYYDGFCRIAPRDPQRYILQYRLSVALERPDEELIEILENMRRADPNDRWLYILAQLYAKTGKIEEAVEVCNEVDLWFGFDGGKYVERAAELKEWLLDQPVDGYEEEAEEAAYTGAAAYEEASYSRENEDISESFEETDEIPESYEETYDMPESYEETWEEAEPEEVEVEAEEEYEAEEDFGEEEFEPEAAYEAEEASEPEEEFWTEEEFNTEEKSGTEKAFETGEEFWTEEEFDFADAFDTEEAAQEEPEFIEEAEEAYEPEVLEEAGEAYEPEVFEEAEEEAAPEVLEEAEAEEEFETVEEFETLAVVSEEPETEVVKAVPAAFKEEEAEAEAEAEIEAEPVIDVIAEPEFDIDAEAETETKPEAEEETDSVYRVSQGANLFSAEPEEEEITEGMAGLYSISEIVNESANVPEDEDLVLDIGSIFLNDGNITPNDRNIVPDDGGIDLDEDDEHVVMSVMTPEMDRLKPQTPEPDVSDEEAGSWWAEARREAEKNNFGAAPEDAIILDDDDADDEKPLVSNKMTQDLFKKIAARKNDADLYGSLPINPDITRRIWHFVITASSPALAEECAKERMLEIARQNPGSDLPKARLRASRIGSASIVSSLDHFLGKMTIIEEVGQLSDAQLNEFTKIMDKDDRSLLIAFTDTKENIIKLFERAPRLASCFTAVFDGRRYTAGDLRDIAKEHLNQEDARLTRDAELIVLKKAEELIEAKAGSYQHDIIEFVDKAMDRAEHGGFLGMGAGKISSDGVLLIDAKHFKGLE